MVELQEGNPVLLRFDEAKTAPTLNIENVAQSTLVNKTSRRKTMAVFTPATESEESGRNPVTSPPKSKARRKSIVTCSQSVPKDGIDSDKKSEEFIKLRRKSTTNIKNCQIGPVCDNRSDVSGDAVVSHRKRKTRRSSVPVFSTISEDTEVTQNKGNVRMDPKKSNQSPDRDEEGVTVQEILQLLKSKPSNPSILRTPMKEMLNDSPSLPGTPKHYLYSSKQKAINESTCHQ